MEVSGKRGSGGGQTWGEYKESNYPFNQAVNVELEKDRKETHPALPKDEQNHSAKSYSSMSDASCHEQSTCDIKLITDQILNGRYRIGERLGIGLQGEVKLGTDITTGEQVALKLIDKQALYEKWKRKETKQHAGYVNAIETPESLASVVEFGPGHPSLRRVKREVEVMRLLSSEPNTVQLKEVFWHVLVLPGGGGPASKASPSPESRSVAYSSSELLPKSIDWEGGAGGGDPVVVLVLELATGGELFDYMFHTGALPEPMACELFVQLASALRECHERGVCHRDVKPENILLTSSFRLKLADFGLSAYTRTGGAEGLETKPALLETRAGTRSYMAPEVLAQEQYSARRRQPVPGGRVSASQWSQYPRGYSGEAADVWSAGVVLFLTLSGFPPFQLANREDWWFNELWEGRQARFWKAHLRSARFSPTAMELLTWMLDPDPARRPTMKQILRHSFCRRQYQRLCAARRTGIASADEAGESLREELEKRRVRVLVKKNKNLSARKRTRNGGPTVRPRDQSSGPAAMGNQSDSRGEPGKRQTSESSHPDAVTKGQEGMAIQRHDENPKVTSALQNNLGGVQERTMSVELLENVPERTMSVELLENVQERTMSVELLENVPRESARGGDVADASHPQSVSNDGYITADDGAMLSSTNVWAMHTLRAAPSVPFPFLSQDFEASKSMSLSKQTKERDDNKNVKDEKGGRVRNWSVLSDSQNEESKEEPSGGVSDLKCQVREETTNSQKEEEEETTHGLHSLKNEQLHYYATQDSLSPTTQPHGYTWTNLQGPILQLSGSLEEVHDSLFQGFSSVGALRTGSLIRPTFTLQLVEDVIFEAQLHQFDDSCVVVFHRLAGSCLSFRDTLENALNSPFLLDRALCWLR